MRSWGGGGGGGGGGGYLVSEYVSSTSVSLDFYALFCYVFSVTKHQMFEVARVVNLVYTYLTRIQFE